jgi:hypothetical protein
VLLRMLSFGGGYGWTDRSRGLDVFVFVSDKGSLVVLLSLHID